MKKILNSIMIVIALMIITCNAAYAEPKIQEVNIKRSEIKVQAYVPPDFDKKIYVNFGLEDGTNASYTLDNENKYNIDGLIKVGNAKLIFVKIVGVDDKLYSHSCSDNIDIKEGEKATFTIKVTKNDNDSSKSNVNNNNNTNTNNQNPQNEKGTKVEEELGKNDNDSIEEPNSQTENISDTKNNTSKFFKDSVITLTLLIVLGGIYLVIKARNRY